MEQIENTKNSLEEKLKKLIDLLSIVKKVSNNIFDDEVDEMFLDCIDAEDMTKKWEKIKIEYRTNLRDLYKCVKAHIDANYITTISQMVEQQGMCIHYDGKDYRLIKVYDSSVKNGVLYLFSEYQNTNLFNEIRNKIRITIKDDKILNVDNVIAQEKSDNKNNSVESNLHKYGIGKEQSKQEKNWDDVLYTEEEIHQYMQMSESPAPFNPETIFGSNEPVEEQRGLVLTKKKTPPRNTGNK